MFESISWEKIEKKHWWNSLYIFYTPCIKSLFAYLQMSNLESTPDNVIQLTGGGIKQYFATHVQQLFSSRRPCFLELYSIHWSCSPQHIRSENHLLNKVSSLLLSSSEPPLRSPEDFAIPHRPSLTSLLHSSSIRPPSLLLRHSFQ